MVTMKSFPGYVILCALMLRAAAGLAAAGPTPAPASLAGPRATLTLDGRGLSLAPRDSACPAIAAQGGPLWSVVIQAMGPTTSTKMLAGKPLVISSTGQTPRREVTADAIRLVYDRLGDGQRSWKIGLTLEIRRQGEAFAIGGELRNEEKGWLIRELNGPVLSGIQASLAAHPLLFPNGLGKRISQVPAGKAVSEVSATYPSGEGTMQWCAFAGERGGLYFGCHDATHGAKTLVARLGSENKPHSLLVKHRGIFLRAGQRWPLPPVMVFPYSGSWHVAAHYYRAWSDSATPLGPVPDWARGASGWLLCILKQQNGEVMWDYPSLAKLCDVADQRGLDILGLFGWAQGGHDHLYPDYNPDPKMGGPEALRKVLAEVHRRGKHAIIYANGQLIDRSTGYWATQGKDQGVIQENGVSLQETWQKYRNFPAQHFDIGCHVTKGWNERMLALALQAHALGADGILFDQLGVVGPKPCFAANHGHPAPAMVYTGDRRAMLRRIADHMRKIDPNFIIMTEGLHDSLLDSISLFHGCVQGVFTPTQAEILSRIQNTAPSAAFPEMFRFTFPEVMTTVRHPTPMMDRVMANYACAYGLRFEIESRYAPDVRYLKEGAVPSREDYREVLGPPNVAMMRATPPAEAARYQKQVTEFMRANAGLFWRGRFVDDEGFTLNGRNLLARGYAQGDRLGVVVWNPADTPATFSLAVPGARLIGASEPERETVEPFGPLPAQSIRLLVWKKTGAE
jgi:hypothetical protein